MACHAQKTQFVWSLGYQLMLSVYNNTWLYVWIVWPGHGGACLYPTQDSGGCGKREVPGQPGQQDDTLPLKEKQSQFVMQREESRVTYRACLQLKAALAVPWAVHGVPVSSSLSFSFYNDTSYTGLGSILMIPLNWLCSMTLLPPLLRKGSEVLGLEPSYVALEDRLQSVAV